MSLQLKIQYDNYISVIIHPFSKLKIMGSIGCIQNSDYDFKEDTTGLPCSSFLAYAILA